LIILNQYFLQDDAFQSCLPIPRICFFVVRHKKLHRAAILEFLAMEANKKNGKFGGQIYGHNQPPKTL